MQAQAVLLIEPATTTRRVTLTPRSPVRVFLLSDRRLLREALAHVLKNHADILFVGAEEFSAAVAVESIASACNVLLADPLNTGEFNAQAFEVVNVRFPKLRIVKIDMEAGISDLISSILSVPLRENT